VATTTNESDDPIAALARRCGVSCYRGSDEDVLGRVLEAGRMHEADVIVEATLGFYLPREAGNCILFSL